MLKFGPGRPVVIVNPVGRVDRERQGPRSRARPARSSAPAAARRGRRRTARGGAVNRVFAGAGGRGHRCVGRRGRASVRSQEPSRTADGLAGAVGTRHGAVREGRRGCVRARRGGRAPARRRGGCGGCGPPAPAQTERRRAGSDHAAGRGAAIDRPAGGAAFRLAGDAASVGGGAPGAVAVWVWPEPAIRAGGEEESMRHGRTIALQPMNGKLLST